MRTKENFQPDLLSQPSVDSYKIYARGVDIDITCLPFNVQWIQIKLFILKKS